MTGFFHFYEVNIWIMLAQRSCVNALWRAFFISTREMMMSPHRGFMVSMPYDGLFSFLPRSCAPTGKSESSVSMPYDGLFSFLRRKSDVWNGRKGVSMPYDGLFSFLRSAHFLYPQFLASCQCPMTGFFHFYQKVWELGSEFDVCQCPMTGFFHFYNPTPKKWEIALEKVSMPYDGLFSFLPRSCAPTGKSESSVSMPYDGLFSFLRRKSDVWNGRKGVSMPYDGLFSFLRSAHFLYPQFLASCQCPMTGFFHFYQKVWELGSEFDVCQCPMTGFFHFYLEGGGTPNLILRCQCPMTGFFHFYRPSSTQRKKMSGVNALWRAFFISTPLMLRKERFTEVSMPYDGLFSFLRTDNGEQEKKISDSVNALWRAFFISTQLAAGVIVYDVGGCQCPMTGFFHFYRRTGTFGIWGSAVSMPYDGLFSFLPELHPWRGKIWQCVNALWRAFFISTEILPRTICKSRRVSMPYDGLFSFLHGALTKSVKIGSMCQCPMTGFFHFYATSGCRDDCR